MIKSKIANKKQIITVTSAHYVDLIIPYLLEKSFEAYSIRDFHKKEFQVSVHENAYATAGIVLTVLGIEAYRNRMYFLERETVSRSVGEDISSLFYGRGSDFPQQDFENVLNEVFVLRDVIVHNHIYKVDVFYDKDWEVLGHRQTLLEGYGDDRKFKNLVNRRTKKTVGLNLNIQPAKVGFEDLLTVLAVLDTFIGISRKLLGTGYLPFHFWRKFEDYETDELYEYLTHYYKKVINEKYLKNLNTTLVTLRNNFETFMPEHETYFITNYCPKCKAFGFNQPGKIHLCKICGFEIRIGKPISGNGKKD